jgi:hypothetical protein
MIKSKRGETLMQSSHGSNGSAYEYALDILHGANSSDSASVRLPVGLNGRAETQISFGGCM